jgi:hypothetical protein
MYKVGEYYAIIAYTAEVSSNDDPVVLPYNDESYFHYDKRVELFGTCYDNEMMNKLKEKYKDDYYENRNIIYGFRFGKLLEYNDKIRCVKLEIFYKTEKLFTFEYNSNIVLYPIVINSMRVLNPLLKNLCNDKRIDILCAIYQYDLKEISKTDIRSEVIWLQAIKICIDHGFDVNAKVDGLTFLEYVVSTIEFGSNRLRWIEWFTKEYPDKIDKSKHDLWQYAECKTCVNILSRFQYPYNIEIINENIKKYKKEWFEDLKLNDFGYDIKLLFGKPKNITEGEYITPSEG